MLGLLFLFRYGTNSSLEKLVSCSKLSHDGRVQEPLPQNPVLRGVAQLVILDVFAEMKGKGGERIEVEDAAVISAGPSIANLVPAPIA
jgi:hypothetical protein